MFLFFFFVYLLSVPNIGIATPSNLFILAGQSNMSGRGGISPATGQWDAFIPPESQSNPSVLRLNAQLQWETAREPLHVDIDGNSGVGPGMAFANRVVQAKPGQLGLVPCAKGGTKISEWQRGGEHYETMVRRAKAAQSGGGTIRALLWYQGESDTASASDADSYQAHMEKFIADVREDLNFSDLPLLQVALASGQEPNMEKVRQAQFGIHLSNVVTVDAKGLPLQEDYSHLTTQAQVQLGNILADAYLKYF